MSDIGESIKKLIEEIPWLEEPIIDLREGLGIYQKNMQDLFFRVRWLETYTHRMMGVLNILLRARGGCLRCWFSSVNGHRMRLELDSFGGGS